MRGRKTEKGREEREREGVESQRKKEKEGGRVNVGRRELEFMHSSPRKP